MFVGSWICATECNVMEYHSPLRYPGGKAKVADFVQGLFQENGLEGGVYVEPYVGGGAVALSLLLNGFVKEIHINDKDVSIYAFWHSVLYETEKLCKLIWDTPVTVDSWLKLRAFQKHKEDVGMLDLGFSTFFLNRTNRSGILTAGIIGGYEQTGSYKMDARFNKGDLIRRIQRIAGYADKIFVTNVDAIDLIRNLKAKLPSNTLFYLDPPYYVKGKRLYMNYYTDQDHRDIAEAVRNMGGCKWIVSYDNVPFIINLYSKYRRWVFELNYSVCNSGKGQEVMIFGDNIVVPDSKLLVG